MGGILGGVNDLLFGATPTAPDAMAAADKQMQASRPNQTTPFGSSQWSQDANGNWSQNTAFDPKMQGAADSLMTQWGQNAANGYGTGDDARRQSVDASWGQFQRMQNPLMAQREGKSRSDLLNMGADMGSEAYNTGMGNTLQANDNLRLNAMDQAVQAGDRAQGQTFNQNRQAWSDPLNALGTMQGMLQMPSFQTGGNYQTAAQQQFGNDMTQYGTTMDNITGLLNGAGQVGGMLMGMPPGFSPNAGGTTGWGGQQGGRNGVVTQGTGNFSFGT
jgi:hypothetical protein